MKLSKVNVRQLCSLQSLLRKLAPTSPRVNMYSQDTRAPGILQIFSTPSRKWSEGYGSNAGSLREPTAVSCYSRLTLSRLRVCSISPSISEAKAWDLTGHDDDGLQTSCISCRINSPILPLSHEPDDQFLQRQITAKHSPSREMKNLTPFCNPGLHSAKESGNASIGHWTPPSLTASATSNFVHSIFEEVALCQSGRFDFTVSFQEQIPSL